MLHRARHTFIVREIGFMATPLCSQRLLLSITSWVLWVIKYKTRRCTLTVETENNTKIQPEMLWLANYPKGQM